MRPSAPLHAGLIALAFAALICQKSLGADRSSSPLANAVESADTRAIRELLKQHADVMAAQPDGMTALHWAVRWEDMETVKALLKLGAAVSATNHYGVTPIALACSTGNGTLVELLLNAGADPNSTLRGGETALMTAARTGKPGPVEALLKRGANVNAKERRGQTALLWAAAEGHARVVELLISAGADFKTPLPDSGFTPLHLAAREGRTSVATVLIKAGVDPNEPMLPRKTNGKGPKKGMSPLLMAVENGHFEFANSLLDQGADPNDQRSGFSALHTLTWVRKPNRGDGDDGDPSPIGSGNLSSLQFIRKLVQHGADVNLRLTSGKPGKSVLNRMGATPFLLACVTADTAMMRLLVELGADPKITNSEGSTPLMAAAGLGTLAPTEEAGTEPEVIEAVNYLLDLGADPNAVDSNGDTAMHGAAYKNLPEVVTLLADRGARPEIWHRKNRHGWSPITIAEGFRVGNFKPSVETLDALHRALRNAGIQPPPPTPRVAETNEYGTPPASKPKSQRQ